MGENQAATREGRSPRHKAPNIHDSEEPLNPIIPPDEYRPGRKRELHFGVNLGEIESPFI